CTPGLEELPVIALHAAVPDLDLTVDALEPGLFAQEDSARVLTSALPVVRVLGFHRLHDRRVLALLSEPRAIKVTVGDDAVVYAADVSQTTEARKRRVTRRLRVASEDVGTMQLPVLLQEVVAAADIRLERLRVRILRIAEHLRWSNREGLVGALLHERGGDERDVGQAGGLAGLVLAAPNVVDGGDEHGRRSDHREVVAARLDLGVA